jgi:hypothetical protein
MIFIFQSDNFISNLLGLSASYGGWIYSVILIFFFLMSFTSVFIQGKVSASLIFYYPLAVFGVVFFVSMFSAAFIFEKPIMDWLPSLYIYIPIFIFYFLHVLNYKMEEVVLSIVFTSILVSIMLVIDQYSELSILDYYVRKSTILACFSTVSINHFSRLLFGVLITTAPVIRLAIHLEIARDIKAPPKPNTAEKISRAFRSRSEPFSARMPSTPSRLSVMLSKTRIAILVIKNKKILFMSDPGLVLIEY